MNTDPRGAEILVKTLQQAGVEKIFALSGNHIMPVFDALRDTSIQLYHVRHEGAAVHMAEAYARLSGKLGVALVTGGPGHANAIGALYTARQSETPLLLLSGHAALGELGKGAFQEMDQPAIAAPLTKAAWMVASPAHLAQDLASAISLAQEGRPGPVHLSLPVDCLEQSLPYLEPLPPTPAITHMDGDALGKLLGHLNNAARPLIVLPPALCTAPGQALAAALAAHNLPVIPMESPRGLNDPALGDVQSLFRRADLILLAGKKLDFTLKFGNAPAARWIVIDPESAALTRAGAGLGDKLAFSAQADIAPLLRQLAACPLAASPARTAWHAEAAAALARRPPPPAAPPEALNSFTMCARLGAYVQKLQNPIFICDGGEVGQWAQSLIQAPSRVINGVAGAIGSALPFALGAKAAAPHRPVLAVMGDGTFGFHMAEFETALRHNLPFVAIIGNDARWNAEYQIQKRDFGPHRTFGCELLPGTRYDAAVAALGGHGELVTSAAEIEPALDRAFASQQPACVNILIDGLPAPKF